jgi:predicted esterase YcpF (UPF0227 family)
VDSGAYTTSCWRDFGPAGNTVSTTIVYLHGLNSGPASVKAQQLGRAISALDASSRPAYFVPQLHHRPADAMRAVMAWLDTTRGHSGNERPTLVGSSLGGFYATFLAERYGARAVVINPAIRPAKSLASYLGPQRNTVTGEAYELTRDHFAELDALQVARITEPRRYLLLVQSGDELLDWQDAVAFYGGAWQSVQGGGDHAFQHFETQIAPILRFAGVSNP